MDNTNFQTHPTVPIAMAFDQGFLLPAAVAITSILENGDPNTAYRFFFFVNKEDLQLGYNLFQTIAQRYSNFSFEYRSVDLTPYLASRLPYGCPSPVSFARLLMADLLPELDRCLYLDGDIIVLDDVAKLFRLAGAKANSNHYFFAAPDLPQQNTEGEKTAEEVKRLMGRKNLKGYVNTGVMVMNLAKMRRDKLTERFLEHADKGYFFGDQDILNVVCEPQIGMLPARWNMLSCVAGGKWATHRGCTVRDKIDVKKGDASILHFAGSPKPWTSIGSKWDRLWADYAQLLPRTSETESLHEVVAHLISLGYGKDRTADLASAQSSVLYGFTWQSRTLLDYMLEHGMRAPICFCDNDPNKQGSVYRDVPCISLDQARELMNENAVVVVCAQQAWFNAYRTIIGWGTNPNRILRYQQQPGTIIQC